MPTPEEYIPGGGLSAGRQPRLDPRDQERQEAAKLMFQYGKPYSQQYEEWGERHPVQQFGLETAASLIPVSRVVKRVPGMGSLGDIMQQAERVMSGPGSPGGWKEGMEIAPKYRHPLKRKLNEELDQRTGDVKDYVKWVTDPNSIIEGGKQEHTGQLNYLLNHLKTTKTNELPEPQRIQVFRSSTRSGNLPGRAIYTTVDPRASARFNVERGEKRGLNFSSLDEEMQHMRQVRAMDVEYKKPLLYRTDLDPRKFLEVTDAQLKLSDPERIALKKTMIHAMKVGDKYGTKPIERMTPAEKRDIERPMVMMERTLARLARKRGHDVILKGGGNTIPEVIILDKNAIKPMFAGEGGTQRKGPPNRPVGIPESHPGLSGKLPPETIKYLNEKGYRKDDPMLSMNVDQMREHFRKNPAEARRVDAEIAAKRARSVEPARPVEKQSRQARRAAERAAAKSTRPVGTGRQELQGDVKDWLKSKELW